MCIINITTDIKKLADNLKVARRTVEARGVFYMTPDGNVHFSKEKFRERKISLPDDIKWGVIHHRHATSGSVSNNNNNHPWYIKGKERTIVGCQYGAIRDHYILGQHFKFDLQGECDSEVGLQIVANIQRPTFLLQEVVIGTLVMWHYEKKQLIMYNNMMNSIYSDFVTTMNVPGHFDRASGWYKMNTNNLTVRKIKLN